MEINYKMKDREHGLYCWELLREAYNAVDDLPEETPKEIKQLLKKVLNEGYILAQNLLSHTEDLAC